MDTESRRVSQAEALALWNRYRSTGDARLRDRLIMTYAPLVKYIVYRKIREVRRTRRPTTTSRTASRR